VTPVSSATFAPTRLTVFGFGLIGASIALAAKARWPKLHVTAIDRQAVIDLPKFRASADVWLANADAVQCREAFRAADLTVLAAPLSAVESILPEALSHCRLVTDCGSTKRSVLALAAGQESRAHFVGGHPMAGKPVGGLAAADPGLFEGRTWILCAEGAAAEAAQAVAQFVQGLGATPTFMDAAEHDRVAALTSHVPQLLASALLVLAAREQVPSSARGPGFESATRVAGGAENIWSDIFARNGDEIARSLNQLIAELQALGSERGSVGLEAAAQLLDRARRLRGD